MGLTRAKKMALKPFKKYGSLYRTVYQQAFCPQLLHVADWTLPHLFQPWAIPFVAMERREQQHDGIDYCWFCGYGVSQTTASVSPAPRVYGAKR